MVEVSKSRNLPEQGPIQGKVVQQKGCPNSGKGLFECEATGNRKSSKMYRDPVRKRKAQRQWLHIPRLLWMLSSSSQDLSHNKRIYSGCFGLVRKLRAVIERCELPEYAIVLIKVHAPQCMHEVYPSTSSTSSLPSRRSLSLPLWSTQCH